MVLERSNKWQEHVLARQKSHAQNCSSALCGSIIPQRPWWGCKSQEAMCSHCANSVVYLFVCEHFLSQITHRYSQVKKYFGVAQHWIRKTCPREQIEALTNVGQKNANFMCYVMMLRRKCPTPMGLKTKCKNCSNESFGRLSVHLRDGVCGWTVVDLVFPCSLWPGTLEESQIYDMYIHIYIESYIWTSLGNWESSIWQLGVLIFEYQSLIYFIST